MAAKKAAPKATVTVPKQPKAPVKPKAKPKAAKPSAPVAPDGYVPLLPQESAPNHWASYRSPVRVKADQLTEPTAVYQDGKWVKGEPGDWVVHHSDGYVEVKDTTAFLLNYEVA